MKMLNAGNKSEGTVQSEPDFGGTSILGKGALHGFEVEGLVALEGDAAGVEGQLRSALVQAEAQSGLSGPILPSVVVFCPIDASTSLIVGVETDGIQPSAAEDPSLCQTGSEGVARDERHVSLAVGTIAEPRVRKTIGSVS